MACLNVANFGPIKRIASTRKGLEERKVTMLIGPQGSGKSTLLKLLCACHWLEKAYAKGLLAQNAFQTADLLKHQFDYYRMASYEQEDTVIDFQGEVLHLSYRHGKLDVDFKQGGQPPAKLLYVPSERSLVSLMKDYKAMRKLPESLLDFMGDYDSAKKYMVGDLNLGLPATSARYDAGCDQMWILHSKNKTRLEEAASGYQSLTPLKLTVEWAGNLQGKEDGDSLEERMARMKQRKLNATDASFGFLNFVEEPEQNLYPDAQVRVLNFLLSMANLRSQNKLMVTTHSPYLLNALTLAVKAGQILQVKKTAGKNMVRILPLKAAILDDDYAVWQLDEKGVVRKLEDFHGLPLDENFLNTAMGKFNSDFGKLQELEDEN